LAKKKKQSWLKSLLLTTVGILLFALVLWAVLFRGEHTLSSLRDKFNTIPSTYYIAILFFTTVTHFSRALRWRLMVQATGNKPRLGTTVLATMSAYFVNQGLPRVGEVTRCTVLADTDKVPLQTSIGTVIAERVTDILCMLVISTTILLFHLNLLYDFVYQNLYTPLVKLYNENFTKLLVVGFVGLILLTVFLWWWRGYYRKHKDGKLSEIIKGLLDGLLSVFRLKKQWQFWGHTAFIWFMYFVMTWYWFDAFPSIANFTFGQILFIFALGNFSRAIPIQAGALPVYMLLVSQALILLGADPTEAGILVLIIPGIQTLFYLVAGGGCFAVYLLFRGKWARG
jgi:glycosyltransferase 2 family protein